MSGSPCRLPTALVCLGTSLTLLSALATTAAATPTPTTKTRLSAPAMSTGVALGAYASGFPGSGTQLAQFEAQAGNRVAVSSSFRGWGDLFPDSAQLPDSDSGHTLLVAWDLGASAATRFTTFTARKHDAYLAQEAAVAKAYGKALYIRPWAEMNGDWSAFQPTPSGDRPAGGTAAEFIAAWRYLITFFRSHGATNVRWVFNPTTDTYAGTTPITTIWPGKSYVDVLGLDGYNWGTGGVFIWRSFRSIYATQYARIAALDPSLPVWICETGSKEPTADDGAPVDPAHSKADWYRGMISWLTGTRVRAVVLFDAHKERDWRVASDPAAVQVVRGFAATAQKSIAAVAAR